MNPFNLRYLQLTGDARQIGRAHGEELRGPIQEMLAQRIEGLAAVPDMNLERFLDMLFEETRFFQTAERWTPQVVEEVRGISEGAGMDFRTAFAWQLLDETDWYLRDKFNPELGTEPGRCSSLGAFGQAANPTIIAQNADMGKSIDGLGVILHKKNLTTGLETLVVSIPGVLGIWGLNNRGIGVCMNAMDLWLHHSVDGLGTIFVSGGLLSQTTFSDADHFIRTVPHASGENYIVGASGIAVDYEASANQVIEYLPSPAKQVVYHTNHQIVNRDIALTPEKELTLPEALRTRVARGWQNTLGRFCSVEARMNQLDSPLTVEKTKTILSAHDDVEDPVCRHKRDDMEGMTNFCIICELSEQPAFHVSSGPPCMTEFRTFRFME